MDDASTDDADLLRRCGAGEVGAFATLVRRHQAAVTAVAFAIVCDREQALELAQEAFVTAWQRIREVREPDRVRAWLCGIVRFGARDLRRRDRRRAALAAQQPADDATVTSPAEALVAAEDQQLLVAVVAALPPTYREPLLLHHVAGCSVADIAAALALSEDAVKQRLSRGRAALRTELDRHDADLPRFTRAALALAPTPMFTQATIHAAVHRAPPRAPEESFMAAHPVLVTAVLVVAAGAGLTFAAARGTHPRSSPAAPTVAPPIAPTPVPVVVNRPAAPGDRAALLAAIRAARARARTAAPPTAVVEPRIMTYDFAGELLSASAALPPPPPPAVDPPQLSKAAIRAAFAAVRPTVVACYQAALARTPGLTGALVVQVHVEVAVGVGGVASEPVVADDPAHPLGDPALLACVRDAAVAVELPMPDEDLRLDVNYPYTLTP